MAAPGRCKGSILVHLRSYAQSNYSEGAWDEVITEASPEHRAILQGIIIAGGWYPVEVWNHALGVLLPRHRGVSIDHEMRKIAAHIADKDLNSVYKMILRLGSPEFLLRRTDSLWGRYFDSGKLTHEEVGLRRFKLFLDAPATTDAPDRLTCDPGVCAWIEMGMKNTGVEGQVKHLECRFTNGSRCEYVVTW
jgi:hypothetical protein